MSTPRRDNGLRAERYTRLADVDTHLADAVLERLRDAGVAAYSSPAAGRRGYYGEMVPPFGPSDSVWVDSARRDEAQGLVDAFLAEVAGEADRESATQAELESGTPTELDSALDSAWAGIVAAWDREPTDPVPRWPASEDIDERDTPEGADEQRTSGALPTYVPESDRAHRDEEHFEPPPPPPLPSVDTVGRFAWAGVLGGPAVLLLGTFAGFPIAGWVGGLAVAAFVAGFVTLVARMKDRPDTDSGPDDGAVV